jgi:transposase InsO family protein
LALVELSVVEQRYRAVLAVERGEPKIVVAAQFGVSRQTLHTWLTRYAQHGLAGLLDRTHRPPSCPHQASAEVESRVCELRREHPRWGPRRIAHELAAGIADGSALPGKSTVHRILRRHGLIEPGRRRGKHRTYRRWERQAPMALWQLDIVGGVFLTDGTECKVVTGVDDHSRFCVMATVVPRATGRAVCLAFAEALRRYGVPEEVLTDNGKQFTDRFGKGGEVLFDRICRDNAITHRLTQPASPTTTGKVERFRKTLRREFLDHTEPFETLLAAQAAVDTYVTGYNCDRPHQALEMGYPAQRFTPSQQQRTHSEELIPLRLPANLQTGPSPATAPVDASVEPVEPLREDTDAPAVPAVYRGGPVEFDRVVPASGNLAVQGKQFWLGPARAGVTVTFWADHDVIHLSIASARIKTVRSHLSVNDLPRAGRHRRATRRPATPAPHRNGHRPRNRPHRLPRRHRLSGQPPTTRRGDPRRAPREHPHRRLDADVLRSRHPRAAAHPPQPAHPRPSAQTARGPTRRPPTTALGSTHHGATPSLQQRDHHRRRTKTGPRPSPRPH